MPCGVTANRRQAVAGNVSPPRGADLCFPTGPMGRLDAQREQVKPAVGVAEGRGRTIGHARLEREELLSGADREPHRSFTRPSVLPGPAPQDAEPERVYAKALRAGHILHRDSTLVM